MYAADKHTCTYNLTLDSSMLVNIQTLFLSEISPTPESKQSLSLTLDLLLHAYNVLNTNGLKGGARSTFLCTCWQPKPLSLLNPVHLLFTHASSHQSTCVPHSFHLVLHGVHQYTNKAPPLPNEAFHFSPLGPPPSIYKHGCRRTCATTSPRKHQSTIAMWAQQMYTQPVIATFVQLHVRT